MLGRPGARSSLLAPPLPARSTHPTPMSDHDALDFDSETARRPGQLSANGHWVFGSIYAPLTLVGFSFGVWAGAAKPKPVEVADAKKESEKPATPPSTKPNT